MGGFPFQKQEIKKQEARVFASYMCVASDKSAFLPVPAYVDYIIVSAFLQGGIFDFVDFA